LETAGYVALVADAVEVEADAAPVVWDFVVGGGVDGAGGPFGEVGVGGVGTTTSPTYALMGVGHASGGGEVVGPAGGTGGGREGEGGAGGRGGGEWRLGRKGTVLSGTVLSRTVLSRTVLSLTVGSIDLITRMLFKSAHFPHAWIARCSRNSSSILGTSHVNSR